MHTHTFVDVLTRTVAICSIMHTMLPPWEVLNDFPAAQKYYKVFVYSIGYVALNGRSTVYRDISTKEGAQTSKAASNPTKKENQP